MKFDSLPEEKVFQEGLYHLFEPLDVHVTYANGDEEFTRNTSVSDLYLFLQHTLKPGEGFELEVNEVDPTPEY